MSSIVMFVLGIMLVVVALLAFAAKRLGGLPQLIDYLKVNKGITAGIIGFVLFGLVIATAFGATPANAAELEKPPDAAQVAKTKSESNVEWFAFGKVYLGIDSTFKQSPQCEPGDVSDRLTSNGGLIVNILQSKDKRFEFNSKYTHHSCAFNGDRNSYDAVGLSVEYRLW